MKKRNLQKILSFILMLTFIFTVVGCSANTPASNVSETNSDNTSDGNSEADPAENNPDNNLNDSITAVSSLNVALYSYVPDPARFQQAVETQWAQIQPNVALNFVDWDCYDDDIDESLDVFVFDAIFLSQFIEQNYLLPIPPEKVQNKEDLLAFTLDGCTVNGTIYAVPQIICTNLLYNRKGDTEAANVTNIPQLYNIIGDRQTTDPIPLENEGLLIDMSGGTSKACFYLDALVDTTQDTSELITLPDLNNINMEVIDDLKLLVAMGGKEQVEYWPDNNDPYIRAKWLEEGKGRAYIGYTEAMSNMQDYANDVEFKLFSLSSQTNIPLFYGDVIGINAAITDTQKQELAIQLMNVIAASDTMVQAISADSNNPYPQYLLPARTSVYTALTAEYPNYGKLLEMVSGSNNKLFVLGANVRSWLDEAKTIIPPLLFDK